ncbi:MAG TPA: DNA alkylation repair protein [candidate division Zixibacteria bacterium]|nr:DNA alkylation repair protein [candidate division Zixibacteria bacterium]
MPRDLVIKDKPRLWKDFISKSAVAEFARRIAEVYSPFKNEKYVEAVMSDGFLNLELKERIDKMAVTLREFLPENYDKAVQILIGAAPKVKSFENWVLTNYVKMFGLDNFETSVTALEELTKHGTGEFAIRPYMIQYTDKMIPILKRWTKHQNEHVRRLAAEGSRPRGVWTAHIESFKKNPRPVIEILEMLRADDSLYVRKAVANNLNDISKEHPDLVVEVAGVWLKSNHEHTNWIIKRALRTLIKKGHPKALKLMGVNHKSAVEVTSFVIKPARIKVGDIVTVFVELESTSKSKQKLVIDYNVHYVKDRGSISTKTFKWSEKTIAPKATLSLVKQHSFRNLSTRTHYPGEHLIEVLVNGKVAARKSLRLL